MRIDEFLTERQVSFERLYHRPAYTANRVAQMLHVPGKEMAKTVLVRTGHGYILAVLPAICRVDMERLRQVLHEDQVDLATEHEMELLFPDCDTGAMPPFGSLYHLPTLADETLAEDREIVFEGQDHNEAIRMQCPDYLALEHPRREQFACFN